MSNIDRRRDDLGTSKMDKIEFANNPEQRCPVILLCDASFSMEYSGQIRELNRGLKTFKEEVSKDAVAAERVEAAIVSFAHDTQIDHEFALMRNFNPPTLTCRESTDIAQGVETAIRMLRERKDNYRRNGITYYRPWLMLLSDGEHNGSQQAMRAAEQRLLQAIEGRELHWFPIGIDQEGINAINRSLKGCGPAKMLKHDGWRELFVWLSNSMTDLSKSQSGQKIKLPPSPLTDGELEA